MCHMKRTLHEVLKPVVCVRGGGTAVGGGGGRGRLHLHVVQEPWLFQCPQACPWLRPHRFNMTDQYGPELLLAANQFKCYCCANSERAREGVSE